MKSCNFSRTATFCAYPHDDMREIHVNRQTNQKLPTKQRNVKGRVNENVENMEFVYLLWCITF